MAALVEGNAGAAVGMLHVSVLAVSGRELAKVVLGPHEGVQALQLQLADVTGAAPRRQQLLLGGAALATCDSAAAAGVRDGAVLTLVLAPDDLVITTAEERLSARPTFSTALISMAGAFSFLHRRLCCPRRWRFAEPVPSAVRLIDPKLLVAEPPAEPWEEPVAQQPAPEEEATPAEEEEVDAQGEQAPEQSLGLPATAGSSQPAAGNERPEPTLAEQHAFLDAAKNYNFRRVRELLLADPRLVNVQPARRWSALHQAAHCGDPRAVRFLLEYGANLQAVTRDGLTPLEVASPNAFDLLLEATMGALEQEAEPGIPKTSEEVIARLHVWRFEPRSGRDYQCQICLEDITEGEELRTLPCAHFFHTGCVDIWLRDRSSSCPTCRHQVA